MPALTFTNSLEEAWARKADIEAGRLEAINVHDDIYAFINASIIKAYPGQGFFDHYGLGHMPSSMWSRAGKQIRWLAGRFHVRSMKQVDFNPSYDIGCRVNEFKAMREYDARRVEIADTLCKFADTCDRWTKRWPFIANHGL